MNHSIQDLRRTHRCGELSEQNIGQEVTLMGWCHKQRDLGGLIFFTLRDRSGEIQVCVQDGSAQELFDVAAQIRSEFVVAVVGKVALRSSPNPNMPTGTIEVLAETIRILSASQVPPFYIEENSDAKESLRLRHRYLDLRRPDLQRNLMLRHRLTLLMHQYFDSQGFLEIETPMLGRSTPEGARDYLVPSRVFPGQFFALPQSPQLYKQLLMVAGYDRYMQIARCFRDEDLRADRQPEFTQLDLEMSFVHEEEVQTVVEGFLSEAFSLVYGKPLELPLQRMTYAEAMERYGSDKPDLRFGMELQSVSDWAATLQFPVFASALEAGGQVSCIVVPDAADLTRKQLDSLAEYVKTYRARGLAWLAMGETVRSSFLKFLQPEQIASLQQQLSLKSGDLVLFVADSQTVVQEALGQLRCEVARRLDRVDPSVHRLLWVTEFPLLEYDEEEQRYVAKHHPFTAPMEEDIPLMQTNPGAVRARAYDVVMDGTELGGGSIRIHDGDLQNQMFSLLGFTKEQAWENFSFLLEAFQYGVPPHGGCALGLDRLVMLLTGSTSLRSVIAFPKVQTSADLMTQAPGSVSERQWKDLGLTPPVVEPDEEGTDCACSIG